MAYLSHESPGFASDCDIKPTLNRLALVWSLLALLFIGSGPLRAQSSPPSADIATSQTRAEGSAQLPVCADQTSQMCGPPILFAHGICDHPGSWGQVAGPIATYLQANYGSLYPNSTMYIAVAQGPTVDDVIFFDANGNFLSSPPPSNSRLFSIGFFDPDCPYCSPQDFNIENVMNVSVFQKGDELALVIAKIKQITGAPKVMLIGHSLGGLDARSYLENLGLFASHRPGNDSDVVALTTLDTPHMGSPLADISAILPSDDTPTDFRYCIGQPSTNIDDLVPYFPTMQDLNYQSGRASDLPSTLSIDSMVDYVPQTLANLISYPFSVYGYEDLVFEAKGQGILNDGAVSRYSQNLANALTSYPTSYIKPNLISHDIPFTGSLTGACGFPPHVLHELPCVGIQSTTSPQLEGDIVSNLLNNTITVQPSSVVLSTGQTQQFSATQNSSSLSVFYTILEDPSSLMIEDFGLFTAGSPGVFHVVATDTATGRQYGMATVTVSPAVTSSTLQVTVSGTGTGGVISSPQGISCRNSCSYSFPSNVSVVLTASPDQGMVVSAWNGCDTQTGNTCTVSMAAGKTVALTFSTEQSNELPAPALNAVQITGSAASPVGTFSWSQVAHNSGYRILVSNQNTALPVDPNSPNCSPACSPANNGAFDSSQSEAVTVTVSGAGATPTGTVTLSGGGYTSSATTLSSGSTTITIAANTFSASGSVTLTANYSGDSVYTTGSGIANITVNPPYKLSTTTPSAVNPGSPATTTITLTGDPSYSGTVTLACALTTSPSGASDLPTCSVTSGSPITITNGVASGTATVTINTTAATSSSLDRRSLPGWLGGGGGTVLALLIFFGIPARCRSWRNLLGLMVLMVALGGLSACGGGGSGTGGGGGGNLGTTAGTYTFTVTGTGTPAINPTPTVTITLSVN